MSRTTSDTVFPLYPDVRDGSDLDAFDVSFESMPQLEFVEKNLDSRHRSVFEGSLSVSVYDMGRGATRSLGFPTDELVLVLDGTTVLSDSTRTAAFEAGEWFLVPRGWEGVWSMPGHYRELAIVPAREWSIGQPVAATAAIATSPVPDERSASPEATFKALNVPSAAGETADRSEIEGLTVQQLHSDELQIVFALTGAGTGRYESDAHKDLMIYVLTGQVQVVAQDGERHGLVAHDCVVVADAPQSHLELAPRSSVLLCGARTGSTRTI